MAIRKNTVHKIKDLVNSFFNDKVMTGQIDDYFLEAVAILLRPSKDGKQALSSLMSAKNNAQRVDPNSGIYRQIYSILEKEMGSKEYLFKARDVRQLSAVSFMLRVDNAGKILNRLHGKEASDLYIIKDLVKVANSLDKKGHHKLADRVDNLFLKEADDALIEKHGDVTLVKRPDGKIVMAGKDVLEHISTHQEPGIGSIFSGNITNEQIFDFLSTADLNSGGSPFYTASFPDGGYELVKPYDIAMSLPDATRADGPPHKREFSQDAGDWIDIPVAKVATSKNVSDFAVSDTTVIVPNYDPKYADDKTKSLVDNTPMLDEARNDNRLFALATAFPGGMTIEGQSVPKSSEWGGVDNPTWAVILPNQSATESDSLEESLSEVI